MRRCLEIFDTGMYVVIASLLVIGYVSAAPAAESTCVANCFGHTCNFWVTQWGFTCKTVEKEYACSCSGCACQSTVDTFARRAANSSGNGTSTATYNITATVSLAGVSAAQFDDSAKTGFRNAIAATMTVSSSNVAITAVTRRDVSVQFTVSGFTSQPTSQAASLNTALTGAAFKSTLNSAMASEGSSATTTSVVVTQAPATSGSGCTELLGFLEILGFCPIVLLAVGASMCAILAIVGVVVGVCRKKGICCFLKSKDGDQLPYQMMFLC